MMKFAAGLSQPISVGGRAYYQLLNPVGSGVILRVIYVDAVCVDDDAYWTIRSYNTALANEFTGTCNAKFGAGKPLGKCYYDSLPGTALGNIHADFFRACKQPLIVCNPPIVELTEGRGVLFLCHSYEAKTVITIEWEE